MSRFSPLRPGRPPRRWSRAHTVSLTGLLATLTAAGINGWSWLPTGWAVVSGVERSGGQLAHAAPVTGRVLFVSPHPDDETLTAAGLLYQVQKSGGQAFVVFLTNGDGFPWDVRTQTFRPTLNAGDYLRQGRLRMNEALDATRKLGIPKEQVLFLGFPDRGLTRVYTQNYLIPYRSPYTRADRAPYDGLFQPKVPYTGKALEEVMGRVFDKVQPDVVLAPSVLDTHPDHRSSSYVATRLASERGVRLYYYIVHGGVEWPLPKGYHPKLPLSPPRLEQQGVRWQRYNLTDEQQAVKVDAIRSYRSQLRLLSRFMWAFARENELLLPTPAE
ncbi:PIG-L deacetylase family protein [Deinococcus peraridilitoris]|uniref:Putative LmbE-like protein n=1 Tax=Deinococcus peraridilitoris (strain DSM 19664 / LMG 22246 / CIP 109416 / KR-200) TaxID=937777 RepID=L0A7S7_DEIPD|nr:PIG-L family deacetylase [Deinococcus peraridilitoris]AFZ69232.1 putative LmbE-like protein [Deinococcus peraridilitoris DSM 19664]